MKLNKLFLTCLIILFFSLLFSANAYASFVPGPTVQEISFDFVNNKDGTITITGLPELPDGYVYSYSLDSTQLNTELLKKDDDTPLKDSAVITPATSGFTDILPSDRVLNISSVIHTDAYSSIISNAPVWVTIEIIKTGTDGKNYLYAIGDKGYNIRKINYNTNGGDTSNSFEYLKDTESMSSAVPTRDGFVFDGWYTAQTGGTLVDNTAKALAKAKKMK